MSTGAGWAPYPKVTGVQTNPREKISVTPTEQDKMKKCSVCGMAEDANPAHDEDYEGAGKHSFKKADQKSYGDEILVAEGGELKSLSDDGTIEGLAIVFDTTDLTNDRFTKSTELFREVGDTIPILYDHGLDKTIKTRQLGKAEITKIDDAGVWIKGQLKLRDDYEKAIYKDLVKKSKAGLSTGAASHMVSRTKSQAPGIKDIKSWGLAEVSITPRPTEPETKVYAIKSLAEYAEETAEDNDFLKSVWAAREGADDLEIKMIRKEGDKYCVYSEDGSKKLGEHDSKADAQKQLAAIEANKKSWEGAPVKKEGDKWCAYDKDGKEIGKFDSKAEAESAAKTKKGFEDDDDEEIKGGPGSGRHPGEGPTHAQRAARLHELARRAVGEHQLGMAGAKDKAISLFKAASEAYGKAGNTERASYTALRAAKLGSKKSLTEEDFDEINYDPNNSIKGIFEQELAEQTPSIWQIDNARNSVFADIAAAKATEDISGVNLDVTDKVTEVMTEYSARVIPLVVAQITDWVEDQQEPGSDSFNQGRFYLKTLTNSILKQFIDTKSCPGDGRTFTEHSAMAADAVEELTGLVGSTLESMKSWIRRVERKIEFRKADPAYKSGRTISAATLSKLQTTHEALAQAHSHVGDLIALSKKDTDEDQETGVNEPGPDDKTKSLSYEEMLMAITLAEAQTQLALAGNVPS